MPRIINSFRQENPFAKTITDLGKVLFADQMTPALNRAKLEAAQRENFGVEELARLASQHGQIFDPNQAAEAAVLGGVKPADLAMMQTFLSGNLFGPRDARTTNAMAGEGEYGKSAEAFDIDQGHAMDRARMTDATQRYNIDTDYRASRENTTDSLANDYRKFTEVPKEALGPDGQPVFVPQGQLTQPGVQPILSNNQKNPIDLMRGYLQAAEAAGLPPEQANQYALTQISKSKGLSVTTNPDGGVSIDMGGPSGLTTPNLTKAQDLDFRFNKFNKLADAYESLLNSNDPTLFGATGAVRDYAQGTSELIKNVSQMMGGQDLRSALTAMQTRAIAEGADPGVVAKMLTFDPNIPTLQAVHNAYLYSVAEMIAGQEGRGATDKDIARAEQIAGSPQSFFSSQADALARSHAVRNLVNEWQMLNNQRLGRQPPQQPTQGAAPPPPSGQTRSGATWRIVQ